MTGYIIEVDLGDGTQRWVHPSGLLTRQRAEARLFRHGLAVAKWCQHHLDPKARRRVDLPGRRWSLEESPWTLGGPVAGAAGGGT